MSLTYGFDLGVRGTTYAAEQYTETMAHIGGDCVTAYGTQFKITLGSMLSFTIGSGFAYADGCWLKSRFDQEFSLEQAYISGPRYDALAVAVDYTSREVSLKVLTDIDPSSQGLTGGLYIYYLYIFEVKAGATELYTADVSDCRDIAAQLDYTSTVVSGAYEYITVQFSEDISSFQDEVTSAIDIASATADAASSTIAQTIGVTVGTLRDVYDAPTPTSQWLLCDGSAFSGYSSLEAALGSATLPDIAPDDTRLKTWIYAGIPD